METQKIWARRYHAHELGGGLQCDGVHDSGRDIGKKLEGIRAKNGIRGFLRLGEGVPIIADCGAFQYRC